MDRANKPKALSAGTTAELGTTTRSERRAVLVSAKTMPCPNKLGPMLSHGVHTECTQSHTLTNRLRGARREKKSRARTTFWGAKPITRVMDDEERSNLARLRRRAAAKTQYPYFLDPKR